MIMKCHRISSKGLVVGLEFRFVTLWTMLIIHVTARRYLTINLVTRFARHKKLTLRELQSLIGTLNFACKVIVPGRSFLRRLIDLTIGIRRPNFHIRLNNKARLDLAAWLIFLQSFNGVSLR